MFQRYRTSIFLIGLFFLLVSLVLPPPEGLGPEGLRCIGIFATSCLFWVTGVLPLAVTSLSVLALLPLLGVLTPDQSFALFGKPGRLLHPRRPGPRGLDDLHRALGPAGSGRRLQVRSHRPDVSPGRSPVSRVPVVPDAGARGGGDALPGRSRGGPLAEAAPAKVALRQGPVPRSRLGLGHRGHRDAPGRGPESPGHRDPLRDDRPDHRPSSSGPGRRCPCRSRCWP